MDAEAFKILAEDREAVRNLTAVSHADFISAFKDISMLDMSDADKSALLKTVLPEIAAPYFKANEEVSTLMYDANRIHDIGTGLGFDPSAVTDFSRDSFGTLMGETGWAVNNKPDAWQDEAIEAALLLLLGGSLTRAFLNARQENYNKIGEQDNRFQQTKRIAGRKACAWCLRRSLDDSPRKAKFHRNCRCTLGIFYDTSKGDKYRNDTIMKYEADFSAASQNLRKMGQPFTEDDILSELRKSFDYR